MGWITNYKNRTGHGLAKGHKKSKRNKAPLRKIIETIYVGQGLFGRDKVLLECGHTVLSKGMYRARCVKCLLSN